MAKEVPPPAPWRSLMLRHGDLRQRLYFPDLPGPPSQWAQQMADAAARGTSLHPYLLPWPAAMAAANGSSGAGAAGGGGGAARGVAKKPAAKKPAAKRPRKR